MIFFIALSFLLSSIFFNLTLPTINEDTFDYDGTVLGAFESEASEQPANIEQQSKAISEPEIMVKSAAVIDEKSDNLIFGQEETGICPLASITKLMSALVFLDNNPGWEKIYVTDNSDKREGGKINLYPGEKVTLKDLFYLSLVGSDNSATVGLASSLGLSEEEFAKKMNSKALEFGLRNTRFKDATGLSKNNVSTPLEIAKMAKIALENPEIREATLTKLYSFKTIEGHAKKIESTDYLLSNFSKDGVRVEGGKTGYTEAAGYCFAGKFSNQAGEEVIAVVMGGKDINSRFSESQKLAEWALKNYKFDSAR